MLAVAPPPGAHVKADSAGFEALRSVRGVRRGDVHRAGGLSVASRQLAANWGRTKGLTGRHGRTVNAQRRGGWPRSDNASTIIKNVEAVSEPPLLTNILIRKKTQFQKGSPVVISCVFFF